MISIKHITALEILDSRGRPTVKTTVTLNNGFVGAASVPSGASTGAAEAHELRDGDPMRYRGLGCLESVNFLEGEIRKAVVGRHFEHQFDLDRFLIELDGTSNKSRIGANSILSVSLAFARAMALSTKMPLYEYFGKLIDAAPSTMPHLMVNLFSGGAHAGQQVAIQDCLILPQQSDVRSSLETTYEVYQKSAGIVRDRYGMRALTADEGGLAPEFATEEEMMECAMEAIQQLHPESTTNVSLALDVAASQFYKNDRYHLGNAELTGEEFSKVLASWLSKYPILSVEDCFAEEDWENWTKFMGSVDKKIAIVGDDLLCTNPERIRYAIEHNAANSLLLKVNQIGTLYEASEALRLVRSSGWGCVISARSGETEDNWLADLAVGWGADYIKVGSITQSERLAKYNRLLEIEKETGFPMINMAI